MRNRIGRTERTESTASPGSGVGSRAIAPIGVVLLLAIGTVLAGTVATAAFGATTAVPDGSPTTVAIDATAERDRITLTHRAGDPIDVRDLEVRIRVDDEPLARQPPVPFFSAIGFRSGPTGPFNAASDPDWVAGESASVGVAETNAPRVTPGRTVEIELLVDGRRVAHAEAVVKPG
ncbi:type IV pilin [Halorubrum vacuolatum]|uniref:Archaeal Type IV pilin N-terminal domain-containing protein n=1 Tax=Halorubrum vacuolatum TaxID=63740 RepID=A0A238VL46_HALVU|nr:type IV pilin [Halorubrum vacuolatum]SNR34837.1 Protein of unknown function [Halorubrum vacuolatum]